MSLFRAVFTPKKFFAGALDTVIDRLNDKYKLRIVAEIEIIDKKPSEPNAFDVKDEK